MSKHSRIGLFFVILATMSFSVISIDRSYYTDQSFEISGTSFKWPGANTKNMYRTSGGYIPRNIIATRSQIYKDVAVVAFPRYKTGVPFTLGIFKLSRRENYGKPIIEPFPSWSLQEEGNCEALQNAVDIVLDARDIIWVLDVGIVDTLEQSIRHCPPKVVAISVRTGKIVETIDLSNFVNSASRLQYLAVDHTVDDKVYLYISDAGTRAIVAYDVTEKRGIRIVLPQAVTIGCTRRDVLYINLVKKSSRIAILYLTYLGSNRMFSIEAQNLRSPGGNRTIIDIGPKDGKIVFLGSDNGGSIFFRKKGQSDIYTWNIESKFTTDNFVLAQKGNEHRLPTQIIPGNKRLVWVLESNFHDYIQNVVGCRGASVILRPLVKSAA